MRVQARARVAVGLSEQSGQSVHLAAAGSRASAFTYRYPAGSSAVTQGYLMDAVYLVDGLGAVGLIAVIRIAAVR